MTKSPPPVFRPGRIVLWLLPFVVGALIAFGHRALEARGAVEQAGQLLAEGDYQAAEARLLPWRDDAWQGARVRAGLTIAGAFDQDEAADLRPEQVVRLDADAFDLPLIIRAAFERAEFGAVLRLTELAQTLGRPTIPWVTLAAQIENGDALSGPLDPSRLAPAPGPEAESLLVQRVAHHLDNGAKGIAVRDRSGAPIGWLADDHLDLGKGVRPEWIPKSLQRFIQDHSRAGSVRTSLDLELSKIAAESFGRFRGSIVLVDPLTGEILAAVSDRRTHRRSEDTPAFEQAREPASISKLITTAAYIRSGLDPDHAFRRMACRGHDYYDGTPLYCPVIAGPLRSLDRAMAVSCNVGFANLAREIGRPRVLEELRRFGFDRPLGPFPSGKILQAMGDERQLADLSVGLESTEITPLHAALLAATVANDGVMPEPTLLHSKDGKLGLHPELLPRGRDRRVLDPEAVDALTRSMIAVVERGTAMRARTRGFPVAMKTGTASHPQHGFHVNYIGFGPLPEARVAFCVRITNQGTSRRVRMAAVEVTARLLRKLRTVSRKRGWQEPKSLQQPDGPRLVRLGDRLSAQDVSEIPSTTRLRR